MRGLGRHWEGQLCWWCSGAARGPCCGTLRSFGLEWRGEEGMFAWFVDRRGEGRKCYSLMFPSCGLAFFTSVALWTSCQCFRIRIVVQSKLHVVSTFMSCSFSALWPIGAEAFSWHSEGRELCSIGSIAIDFQLQQTSWKLPALTGARGKTSYIPRAPFQAINLQ